MNGAGYFDIFVDEFLVAVVAEQRIYHPPGRRPDNLLDVNFPRLSSFEETDKSFVEIRGISSESADEVISDQYIIPERKIDDLRPHRTIKEQRQGVIVIEVRDEIH